MATALTDIDILEISPVDNAANRWRILVRKQDDTGIVKGALGDWINGRLEEMELTQADLAQSIDRDESTVQSIVDGEIERPPDEILRAIAQRLDVSFEHLFGLLPDNLKDQGEDVAKRGGIPFRKAEIKKVADTLRALAGDRLELMRTHLDTIEGFETAEVEDIEQAFWALSDLIWSAREDIVALAAAAGMSEEAIEQINEIAKQKEAVEMAGHEDTDEIAKVEFTEDEMAAMVAFAAGEATDEQVAVAMKLAEKAIGFGGIYDKPEAVEQQEDGPDEEEDMEDEEEETLEMSDVAKRQAVQLTKQAAALVALQKRLDEETNIRVTVEFVKRAGDEYSNIAKAATLGPILKQASEKMTPDAYRALEKILTQCDAIIEKSELFVELGGPGDPESSADPGAKIETIAKRLVTEGTAPNIFKARVMAQDQHPELVNEIHNREVS